MKECFNYFNTLYEMYANYEDATLMLYFGGSWIATCADACLQVSPSGAII